MLNSQTPTCTTLSLLLKTVQNDPGVMLSSDLKWSDIQWSSHTKFLDYLEESFPPFTAPGLKHSLHILGSFHCFTAHPSAVLNFHSLYLHLGSRECRG
ncbi:hypothetical protein GBAR_LOCUS3725, partial [Geodia barretti]